MEEFSKGSIVCLSFLHCCQCISLCSISVCITPLPLWIIFILPVLRKSSSPWSEQQDKKEKNNVNEDVNMTDGVLWLWESTYIFHWHLVNTNLQLAMPVIFCGKTWSWHLYISTMVLWDRILAHLRISIATPRCWWHMNNNAGPHVVAIHHLLEQSILWMLYS